MKYRILICIYILMISFDTNSQTVVGFESQFAVSHYNTMTISQAGTNINLDENNTSQYRLLKLEIGVTDLLLALWNNLTIDGITVHLELGVNHNERLGNITLKNGAKLFITTPLDREVSNNRIQFKKNAHIDITGESKLLIYNSGPSWTWLSNHHHEITTGISINVNDNSSFILFSKGPAIVKSNAQYIKIGKPIDLSATEENNCSDKSRLWMVVQEGIWFSKGDNDQFYINSGGTLSVMSPEWLFGSVSINTEGTRATGIEQEDRYSCPSELISHNGTIRDVPRVCINTTGFDQSELDLELSNDFSFTATGLGSLGNKFKWFRHQDNQSDEAIGFLMEPTEDAMLVDFNFTTTNCDRNSVESRSYFDSNDYEEYVSHVSSGTQFYSLGDDEFINMSNIYKSANILRNDELLIYPNPVSASDINGFVSLYLNQGGNYNLSVVNNMGQKINSYQFVFESGQRNMFDLRKLISGLSNGIYFVVVESKNSKILHQKFIITD